MSSTDDDDDDGDIPMVKVGGEEFAVTDVNEELKDRMTADEKERYTQIFQDFYSHMYDWRQLGAYFSIYFVSIYHME